MLPKETISKLRARAQVARLQALAKNGMLPPSMEKPDADPLPRWKDGTPKDPILALEEQVDEERFAVDPAYQSRHLEDMARLVTLREERRKNSPPPPPPESAPLLERLAHPSGQALYEHGGKEALIREEKGAGIDIEISRLEERKRVLAG